MFKQTEVLEGFECLDGDFFNETHTMTPFWNSWDLSHTPDMISESLGTILGIRISRMSKNWGFGGFLKS